MDQMQRDDLMLLDKRPQELSRLIRKLRWIGMEDEAIRLQTIACTLPPEERGTIFAGPSSTD
jgi:hypothetical protein